jgi:hypothetical protein
VEYKDEKELKKFLKELFSKNKSTGFCFWNKNEKIVLVPTHLEDYLKNYGQSIYGKLIM